LSDEVTPTSLTALSENVIMPAFQDEYLLTSYFKFPTELQTQVLSVPAKDQELFVRRLVERSEEKKREQEEKLSENLLMQVDEDEVDKDENKDHEDGNGATKSIVFT